MASPVVLVHAVTGISDRSGLDPLSSITIYVLAEGSVDSTLSGNGVTSSGKELGDTGCVEASFRQAECCSKTCSASSHDNSVIFMIDDGVFVATTREVSLPRTQRLS